MYCLRKIIPIGLHPTPGPSRVTHTQPQPAQKLKAFSRRFLAFLGPGRCTLRSPQLVGFAAAPAVAFHTLDVL